MPARRTIVENEQRHVVHDRAVVTARILGAEAREKEHTFTTDTT
jgi:hypothetical protein